MLPLRLDTDLILYSILKLYDSAARTHHVRLGFVTLLHHLRRYRVRLTVGGAFLDGFQVILEDETRGFVVSAPGAADDIGWTLRGILVIKQVVWGVHELRGDLLLLRRFQCKLRNI